MSVNNLLSAKTQIGRLIGEADRTIRELADAVEALATRRLTKAERAGLASELGPDVGKLQASLAKIDVLLDAYERATPPKQLHRQQRLLQYAFITAVAAGGIRVMPKGLGSKGALRHTRLYEGAKARTMMGTGAGGGGDEGERR